MFYFATTNRDDMHEVYSSLYKHQSGHHNVGMNIVEFSGIRDREAKDEREHLIGGGSGIMNHES